RAGEELGCPACADVAMEQATRQAIDRRYGAARACAELSVARRLGAFGHAADAASPILRAARSCWKSNSNAGHAVRTECRRVGPQTANAEWPDAVVRHTRARFQLGDRRSDDDALPCRDGCGGHQGRSARHRRPRARIGTAYGAWASEEEHRNRPEE